MPSRKQYINSGSAGFASPYGGAPAGMSPGAPTLPYNMMTATMPGMPSAPDPLAGLPQWLQDLLPQLAAGDPAALEAFLAGGMTGEDTGGRERADTGGSAYHRGPIPSQGDASSTMGQRPTVRGAMDEARGRFRGMMGGRGMMPPAAPVSYRPSGMPGGPMSPGGFRVPPRRY